MYCVFFFFFFSSRRRHTRCGRDWSSDVCSSDLARLDQLLQAPLFPLRVLDGSSVGVADMEVVERGAGAAQVRLASYLLLVDCRRELLRAVADRGARRSPLGREQLPEGLAPGSLMGRGHQYAVDIEDRATEPDRHAPASPTALTRPGQPAPAPHRQHTR